MPYFFGVLNYSDHYQMPALAEVFSDLGVKTAAIMFIEDLHGIEYQGVATREFLKNGIEVRMVKSVPFGTKDVSPILKEAQKTNADAFCAFNYPPEVFLTTGTAQAIGYNPKAMLLGPGGNFEVYKKIFGQDTIEGVMGEGAWNEKTSKGAKQFVEEFTKRYPRDIIDWWGHLFYWAGLEFFKQAIEKAGTLDQKKIRKVMAKSKFDTVLGKTWFDMYDGGGGLLARECQPGQIGQWQNGIFEVIGPKDKATAKPIYPKAPWPAPKPK
jgi:branched-chain amino acid transport system substrate-binding protein